MGTEVIIKKKEKKKKRKKRGGPILVIIPNAGRKQGRVGHKSAVGGGKELGTEVGKPEAGI